ncbi:Calcineurin-like phosphoesterase [Phytophthora infestans]|uniref:Calcineurin-like phosphoesterase n=1 Tax=Phytophthora infestans TaxID=4787 RepID=A0A8S9UGK3_PHYIN|nr:Calcineurin-like phosphoesterase [Phytophthora infestans]
MFAGLPLQGYYDEVRICRDCSPISIPISSLKQGTRVLVYGILIGRVVQVSLSEGIELVSVELEKQSSDVRSFALHYVQLYSDAVLSANRIKNAIRQHLAYLVYRTRLNFSTWNMLEAMQEQRTMQMMRFVKKSMSINELHSMMPLLGRRNTLDGVVLEKERVKASLTHYRGVRVLFPLRLITVKRLINQFRNGILLHPVFVCRILDEVEKLFLTQHESPMNAIDIPPGVRMVVVGDLHGQLEDLLTIMEKNGAPSSKTWYLFNGDFVDRGAHGVEIMLLLLAFKLMYPAFVFLNRVHGGLSSHKNVTIEELLQLDHRGEPTQGTSRVDELLTHLLWSDPCEEEGWKPSSRGAGVEFGPDITKAFCKRNGISLIIRSHECREEGFDIVHDGLLLTVFSASNYCGSQTNKGAYVLLERGDNNAIQPRVAQFSSQPLQQLKAAGRNEWREKARRLEQQTLESLLQIICENQNALLFSFQQADTTRCGCIPKTAWKAILQRVLGIQANFLSYFHQLAAESDKGGVDYEAFLSKSHYALKVSAAEVNGVL